MKEFPLAIKGDTKFVHESGQEVFYSVKTNLASHIAFQGRIGEPTTGWSKVKEPAPRTLGEEYEFAAEMLQGN